jgi:hypothetical protein
MRYYFLASKVEKLSDVEKLPGVEKLPDAGELHAKQRQSGLFRFSPQHAKPELFGVSYCLARCQSRRSSTPSSSRRTARRTQAFRFMRYYFLVSHAEKLSEMEKPSSLGKLPDAEKLPDGRNFVPGNANAKLGSFGSRRRARNPSISVCRIVLLNANPGGVRCLSVLAAPHAEPKRFGL